MAKKRISLKLDKQLTEDHKSQVNSGEANLKDGVDMGLSPSDKRKVIFRKYESHNPNLSDTNHGDYWLEEVVSHPKLMCMDGDPQTGLTEDDGLIVGLVGRPSGEVAVDMRRGAILSDDEAEESEEMLGVEYPRFTRYDFKVEYVKITNGPKMREEQIHAAEQQRNVQETHMFSKMEDFFSKMMDKMGPEPSSTQTGNIQSMMENLKTQYTPEQIQTHLLMDEIEKEDADMTATVLEADLQQAPEDLTDSVDDTDEDSSEEDLDGDGNI